MKTKFAGYTLVFVIFLVGCTSGGSSGSLPPTPTLSSLTQEEMGDAIWAAESCRGCTSQQAAIRRDQVRSSFVGQRVRWTNWVSDVRPDGTVVVGGRYGFDLELKGMPRHQSVDLRRYQEITFEGTVVAPTQRYGPWTLVDAVLATEQPTPIPTATKPPAELIENYDINVEIKDYGFSRPSHKATFLITNNGHQQVQVYIASIAVIRIVNTGERKVVWGANAQINNKPRIPPGETTTFWHYYGYKDNANNTEDIIQLCLYVYNIVPYSQRGDTIVAELKLDDTLSCD